MVDVRKFSEFPSGGVLQNGDEPVGLQAGTNTRWNFQGGGGGGGNVTKVITQDTSGLTVGRWVRFDNATQLYVHGIATTPELAEIAGVVLNIIDATQFTLQQSGYIDAGTPGFAGFTTDATYFLSDVALGQQTQNQPTLNGRISKPVFIADSPESGWVVCLERGFILGGTSPIPATSGSDTSTHTVSQPGNTFAVGQFVRVSGDNVYSLADGSSFANSQSVGAVTVSGDPNFTIQFSGWNTNTIIGAVDSVGAPIAIVASTVYYLSDVVPGAICPTPPTALNTSSKPVFISASTIDGTGWILPQKPTLIGPGDGSTNVIVVNQALHGFARGDVVRVSGSNTFTAAQSNSAINTLAVGFVIEVIDVNNFILQTEGYSSAFGAGFASFPLIPGSQYYLSSTVAGGITTIPPATAGSYNKPMLIALTTSTGFILEQRPVAASGGGGGGTGELTTWVSFNATTGTPVIGDEENVMSITDNGVGDFSLNYTTIYLNSLYEVAGMTGPGSGTYVSVFSKSALNCRVVIGTEHGAIDNTFNTVMIRGLIA